MKKAFLDLTPKRFLCPYCGEWHKWEGLNLRSSYAYLNCHNIPSEGAYYCVGGKLDLCSLEFNDGYFYYDIDGPWKRIEVKIALESFVESTDEPIVTFKAILKCKDTEVSCLSCGKRNECASLKYREKFMKKYTEIELGFEFEQSDYENIVKLKRLDSLSKNYENVVVTSNEQSLRKNENTPKTNELGQPQIKKDTTNIFNVNMEFGPNNDTNIAGTLMGVAIKNGDSWRIYDRTKKEIIDVGDMQLGNFPIFIIPTTKLNEGDLIKDSGEYYYVMKVDAGSIQTLCVKTGETKTSIPIKNILGISCYSKVIALSDYLNFGDDFSFEKLTAMHTMFAQSGQSANQMNQMLPLLLFKDKLGDDDDMLKMMVISSAMSNSTEVGNQNAIMNQLLPLMFIERKDICDYDILKIMIISSMMSGNTINNNASVITYMMLDRLMECKKKDKNVSVASKADTETIEVTNN